MFVFVSVSTYAALALDEPTLRQRRLAVRNVLAGTAAAAASPGISRRRCRRRTTGPSLPPRRLELVAVRDGERVGALGAKPARSVDVLELLGHFP